jgi:hypothetical protein
LPIRRSESWQTAYGIVLFLCPKLPGARPEKQAQRTRRGKPRFQTKARRPRQLRPPTPTMRPPTLPKETGKGMGPWTQRPRERLCLQDGLKLLLSATGLYVTRTADLMGDQPGGRQVGWRGIRRRRRAPLFPTVVASVLHMQGRLGTCGVVAPITSAFGRHVPWSDSLCATDRDNLRDVLLAAQSPSSTMRKPAESDAECPSTRSAGTLFGDFCFIFAPCGYDEPEILPP